MCEQLRERSHTQNERRVPELNPVLCSQPAGDQSQKPSGRLPLLSAITYYLPSHQASPPIDWYQIILLGDRVTYVNNLPRVALCSAAAGIRTYGLLIASEKLKY